MLHQSLIWILCGAAFIWFGAIVLDRILNRKSKINFRIYELERQTGILKKDLKDAEYRIGQLEVQRHADKEPPH